MATSLGGWFDKVFFDAHGEPCASGELRFYQTGTDIPQGVATFDGTPLGAVVRLDDDGRPESDFRFYTDKIYRVVLVDADGVVVNTTDGVAIPEGEGGAMYNPMTAAGDLIVGGTDGEAERLAAGNEGEVLKVVSGVPTWAPDAEGMQNPMTDPGDLIVGGPNGDPERLAPGADGDILGSWSFGGNVLPKWEAGTKKYRNVYGDIPSSQIDDGYLGCLFYLSASGQTLDLPSSATIPSKSFIDFVCLNDTATLTITPQGTTTLNEQAAAVTIGGKSATLYRLTFLGHGVSGDEWALGGSVLPDGKVKVDGADGSPGYLLDKLTDGDNAHFSKSGNAVKLDTDNDKVAADNTDSAPGYLLDKLYPGDGIAIEAVLDGAVRKVKLSATGGGGGGGSDWREVLPATNRYYQVGSQASGLVRRFYPLGPTVRSVMVMTANYKVGATCKGHIRIYKMQIPNGSTESAEATATMTSIAHKEFTLTVKSGVIWASFDADVDVSDPSYIYFYAIGFNNAANPNPSDYLRFQLSAAVSTSSTASHSVEFHVTTNKLIDSTTPNTLGFTAADYTYVSGISSKVES